MSESKTLVKVQDLTFNFSEGGSISTPAFEVDQAQTLALLGPSGSGKSTLLFALAGMLKPDEGIVEVEGQDLYAMSNKQLDAFRASQYGIIFQRDFLTKSLNAEENIKAAAHFSGKGFDAHLFKELVELVGLGEKVNRRVKDLSIGERQRVSIVRALITRPSIVLADEPTSALDDANAMAVVSLFNEIKNRFGTTVILATHDNRLKSVLPKTLEL